MGRIVRAGLARGPAGHEVGVYCTEDGQNAHAKVGQRFVSVLVGRLLLVQRKQAHVRHLARVHHRNPFIDPQLLQAPAHRLGQRVGWAAVTAREDAACARVRAARTSTASSASSMTTTLGVGQVGYLDARRVALGARAHGADDRDVVLDAVHEQVHLGVHVVDAVQHKVGRTCQAGESEPFVPQRIRAH